MRGIAFLNADGGLGFRTHEFLTESDPMFMSNNEAYILKAWRFDTEDRDSMFSMFSSIATLQLPRQMVLDFSKMIGFDVNSLKVSR